MNNYNKEIFIHENENSLPEELCLDLIELVDNNNDELKLRIESNRLNHFLLEEIKTNLISYKRKINPLSSKKDTSNYVKIKKYIKSAAQYDRTSNIPNNIIQIFDKTDRLHPSIYNNIIKILKTNPEYNYIFITDNEAIELIQTNFGNAALTAFYRLKIGAAKADFIRYIALYVYGGVYLDLDSDINTKLINFIPQDVDFIFFYNYVEDPKIVQWLIMIAKNHFLIKKIIDEMVNRINRTEPNIFLATGPTLFTDVIYNEINKTNIYDFKRTFSIEERLEFLNRFECDPRIMNGLILNRETYSNYFNFHFEKYDESFMYENNERYTINSNIYQDALLKIDELFIYKLDKDNSNIICANKNMCFIWGLSSEQNELLFWNEYQVQIKMGKLLMFPNSWCFPYKEVVKNMKDAYVIYGFFDMLID